MSHYYDDDPPFDPDAPENAIWCGCGRKHNLYRHPLPTYKFDGKSWSQNCIIPHLGDRVLALESQLKKESP